MPFLHSESAAWTTDAVLQKYSHLRARFIIDPRVFRMVANQGSCAVVGSSGMILNSSFGQEIDKHDVVIRMNKAPVHGYEKHVGGFTTIRVNNLYDPIYREAEEFTISKYDAFEQEFAQYVKLLERNWPSGLMIFDPEWVENKVQHMVPGFPTAGSFAIVLATELCTTIDLYGFDPPEAFEKRIDNSIGWPYHYYNNVEPAGGFEHTPHGTPHNFVAEARFHCNVFPQALERMGKKMSCHFSRKST